MFLCNTFLLLEIRKTDTNSLCYVKTRINVEFSLYLKTASLASLNIVRRMNHQASLKSRFRIKRARMRRYENMIDFLMSSSKSHTNSYNSATVLHTNSYITLGLSVVRQEEEMYSTYDSNEVYNLVFIAKRLPVSFNNWFNGLSITAVTAQAGRDKFLFHLKL